MALTTRRRALTTLGAALTGAVALPAGTALASQGGHGPRPLWRAHAHNDYEHPRPLLDALDHRFGSVEADIYLVGGQLLVAHDPEDLDPSRTLESLYLDPLAARVRAHHGRVYRRDRGSLQLLIDIKTEGEATYLELDRRLRRYKNLFTSYAHGRVFPGALRPSSPEIGRPVRRWRPSAAAVPSTTAASPTSAPWHRPRSSR